MTSVTVINSSRHFRDCCYQEDMFIRSIVPYFIQAQAKKEETQFLVAAYWLLCDRFPLPPLEFKVRLRAVQRVKRVRL